jgi:hypothetical protein
VAPRASLLSRFARACSAALSRWLHRLTGPSAAALLAAHEEQADWERRSPIGASGEPETVALAGRRGFVEMPVRSVADWTPAGVKAALRDADSGMLARPADLVEAIMGDDRVQGVLSTRTHGLLGLTVQFYGDDEQVQALEGTKSLAGQPAIPGDWIRMFPEAELAQFMSWGILLGVGLAERVPDPDRKVGERDVPRIKIWHPRWLRHDWATQRWMLTTSEGEVEVTPGDGRWMMYCPYGDHRPWTQGAWRPISFAFVLKQFALHDRARHSEVLGSAARVGVAPSGAKEANRRAFLRDIRNMGRDNGMVLPEGWDLKMVEATGRTWEIYSAQIEWADRAIAITLAGQFVTTEGTKGFSNGNIHNDIKRDLITFTAESLSTCLHDQGVVPWSIANYGSASANDNAAPWQRWDTTPPEDKKSTAEAISTLGEAIVNLDRALVASDRRVDACELANKFGVPLLKGAATPLPDAPKPAGVPFGAAA